MGKKGEEEEEEEAEGQAAAAWASLPSDLPPEILSRVPYRSLCRFKCVSRAWLALCSDPAVRTRSPQALSGFFHDDQGSRPALSFLNLSESGRSLVDLSLRFLDGYEYVDLLNCCGGILLCCGRDRTTERWAFLVCNPATQDIWAALPLPPLHYGDCITSLCFSPAAPSRFAVFIFIQDARRTITSVQVYSSDTGEWTSMASVWGPRIVLHPAEFGYSSFNSTLYFSAYNSDGDESGGDETQLIATVDMEGNTWSTIRVPPKLRYVTIGQSQGRLYILQTHYDDDCRLSVWVLGDHATGNWTLKHTASILELLGRPRRQPYESYQPLRIHPQCNLIFLQDYRAFMSYDMDSKKLHVIRTHGHGDYDAPILWPYIPCFAEQPAVAQKTSERPGIC